MCNKTTTISIPNESTGVSPLRLFRASVGAILALAPFGYLSILMGVAIHEVIGHGLTAIVVGGDFLGFQLDFDGMGHAYTMQGNEAWRCILVLSSGVVATSIIGLALLICGYAFRHRPWIALPLIVLSFGIIMDGIPYLFWNSLKPVPPGDFGRIIAMVESPWLQVILIVLGGTLMVTTIWAFTFLLFAILQSWLTGGTEVGGKARIVLLMLLGFVSGVTWFLFDWDQLVPGIGAIPNIFGFILHMAASGSLLWFKPCPLPSRSSKGIVLATFIGWCLTFISIAAILIWFREGVVFAN